MTRLRMFHEDSPQQPLRVTTVYEEICAILAPLAVTLERWNLHPGLAANAPADVVLATYHKEIERISAQGQYKSVDVLSVTAEHHQAAALRTQFLDEHTHDDNEVRFFVAGSGLFTLHVEEQVYELQCIAGDFIYVPGGMKHWFDMGVVPSFTVIRFLGSPAGWQAHWTGTSIAKRFVSPSV